MRPTHTAIFDPRIVTFVIIVAACGGGDTPTDPGAPPVSVASVTVTPPSASVAVGSTVTLVATVMDAGGNVLSGRSVTWSATDTTIASVSAAGVVTGRKAGSATVTATNGTVSGGSVITVTGGSGNAPFIVSPGMLVKFVNDTAHLAVSDSNGNTLAAAPVWSSGNTAIATVTAAGLVHAVSPGTTTINATIAAATVTAPITITGAPKSLTDVLLHYPISVQRGAVTVASDISTQFSTVHAANLDATWQYYATFFGATPGSHLELYYTRDSSVYVQAWPFCANNVWYQNARQVSGCYAPTDGSWKEFIIPYVTPDFGTQYHEISHLFLDKVHPDAQNFPWLQEGSGMYFESGVFDANGQLVVTTPIAYLRQGFHQHDQAHDLTPIDSLIHMDRTAFYLGLSAGDGQRNYAQAGLFFTYLMLTQRPTMTAMFAQFAHGQLATNAQVIQFITSNSGLSIAQLEQGYLAYARSLP